MTIKLSRADCILNIGTMSQEFICLQSNLHQLTTRIAVAKQHLTMPI